MQFAAKAEFNLAVRQLALQIDPNPQGVVRKEITESIVWFCHQNLQTVDQKVTEQAIQQLTRKSAEAHLHIKQASSWHLTPPTQEEILGVHKRITPFAIQVIKGALNTNRPEIKLAQLIVDPKVDVTAIEPYFGLENLKWNDPIKVSNSPIPLSLLDLTIKFQRTDMTKLMLERLGERLVPSVISLCLAITSGNAELVKLLISHPKIDVNSLYNGCPPLYYACLRKNSPIVDLLIDSTNDNHKNLVLEKVAKEGNYWAVRKLLQANYLFEIPAVYSEGSYQSTLFSLGDDRFGVAELPDLKDGNLLENNLTYIHHLLRNYKNNPSLIRFHLNRYSYDTFYFTMCSLITNLVSNRGNWRIAPSDWWKDLSITKKEAVIEETRRFMCSLEPGESNETWNQKFLEYKKLYLNDAQGVKIHDGDKKKLEDSMHDCWREFSATLFLWYSEDFLVFKHIKEDSLEDVQQYAKSKNIPSNLVSIQLYNDQDKFLSLSSFKVMSPLALACKEGKDIILQTLVTAGFAPYAGMWDLKKCGNVDQEDVLYGCDRIVTAVIEACEQGNINQMQILMTAEGGVNLNYFTGSNFGWTLRHAIQHPKLVTFLLKSDAFPEDADENGYDAIDVALDIEDEDLQEEIVKLILPYFNFASKHRWDSDNSISKTTLEKIKEKGNDELVEALITTRQFMDLDLANAILESLRLGKNEIARKILLKSNFAFTKKFTPEFIDQLKQKISSHLANLNSDSDSDSDSEIQNQNDQNEIADLVLRYLDNPRVVKAELQDQLAAEAYALTIFLCDDLLRLKQPKANRPFTPTELNTQRCFKILKALPIDLQMLMSRRFFGLSGEGIPSKARGAAFARLAESF